MIRTLGQVKLSGSGPKGTCDGERLQAGNSFIVPITNGSWGRCGAHTDVTAAEGEERNWVLETTGGALVTELEADERHTSAGERSEGGSDHKARCPRWPFWGWGLRLNIEYCPLLLSPLPALGASPPSCPTGLLPTSATKSDLRTALHSNALGLLPKPQAASRPPSSPSSSPWLRGGSLRSALTGMLHWLPSGTGT